MRARPSLPASCLCALLLLGAVPARALDVVAQSRGIISHPSQPTTVRLDVWLDLGPGEAAPDLSAFQVAVALSGPSQDAILLPPAAAPTAQHPAVFSENFTPDFAGDDGPARASAVAFLDVGSAPAFDGAGLMSIEIEVAAGTAGTFTLAIDADPFLGTVLADATGTALPYGTVAGVLEISPAAPEPVPSLPASGRVLLLAVLGSALLLAPRMRGA